MSRWSAQDLAEVMSRNSGLRIHRPEGQKTGEGSHPASKPATAPVEAQKPHFSKYRNQKTAVDGIIFDSKREAARYRELKVLESTGEIKNLTLQPKYEFRHNGVRIGSYKPDFRYEKSGAAIIEDVKGGAATKTTAYRLRKKLMLAFFGIEVLET